MTTSHAILGLWAQTSLHAGAGQSHAGVIDLPIQREVHTGWPVVFGSGVKGALRAMAEASADEDKRSWIQDVFGPSTSSASDHAGSISFGDARLVALPVRSLTGHFKWVTCPALLSRHVEDRCRAEASCSLALPSIGSDKALTASKQPKVYLQEYLFDGEQRPEVDEAAKILAGLISHKDAVEQLRQQLVILNDERFAQICRFATQVEAKIAIDSETKTVSQGALWYEESLPPDSLLCVQLHAHDARSGSGRSSAEMLEVLTAGFRGDSPYLQLGGNETVGMGWCKVAVIQSQSEAVS
jgi:CRISPR-associated protein Cmr4